MKELIVKVQRPIVQSEDASGPDTLVYDRGRAHEDMVEFDTLPPWLKAELDKTPKTFAKAIWTPDGVFVFRGRAQWQAW